MAEGSGSGGGGGGSGGGGGTSEPKLAATCEAVGGRQRFTVELIPGQTTIVSWKKLHKDAANKNALPSSKPDKKAIAGPGPDESSGVPEQTLPLAAHPSLNARLAPGQVPENEAKDGPPTSRLSTVIEKIERLYVGKASSDEEDLNDVVPDDDEYDTEDSFIDDAELDEYFQVDNSAIKHDGFFVNRGKLERVGEPTALQNQQPKKRRRKDLAKDDGSDIRLPNKHQKVGKKDGKSVQFNGKNSVNPQSVAVTSVHPENVKNQINSSKSSSKKNSADSRTTLEAPPSGGPNGVPMLEEKDIDKQKVVHPSKNHGNKLKEGRELSGSSNERLKDKSSAPGKSSSGRSFNTVDERSESIQQREKGGLHERAETIVPEGNNSLQVAKVPPIRRKDGSSGKPRSTMLDKAIRELEKLVSESRPPSVEGQDSDNNAFQAVKRRLRPEIKQKLAKVASLAQASHGKITKELLNRLMSIVGHMIQIRSLKRNLETMVSMGLSAKQERDNRVQQIKKEIAEMVKARIPLMNSKALEQLAGSSDDFQESNTKEKEAFKKKYRTDDALEDKICSLYDQYIEGLEEEDAASQVRKMYAEVAALWPDGFMDKYGIKRAICRAKDRRRSLQSRNKDQEKRKRKKVSAPKTENVQVEANSQAQPENTHDKLVSDASDHVLTSGNKSISTTTAGSPSVRMPVSFMSGPNSDDRVKQEKVKGGSGNSSDTKGKNALPTKKMKRKTDTELVGTTEGEERQKSQKQTVSQKPNVQAAAPSSQQLG